MSETCSRIARRLRRRVGDARRGEPARDVREAHVLEVLPRVEVRRRVDGAVVAQERAATTGAPRSGGAYGVPCASPVLPTKPSTSPALTCAPLPRERREGGEVRVVELVALRVAQPEPVAADVVPADREDRARRRTARIGAPSGAKMSSPWCQLPATSPRNGAEACRRTTTGRRPGRRSRPPSAAAAGRSGLASAAAGTAPCVVGSGATGVCFCFACVGRLGHRPGRDRLRRRRRRWPARSPRRSRSGSPSRRAARRAARSGGRRARSRSRGSPACRRRRSSCRCPARASRGSPSRRAATRPFGATDAAEPSTVSDEIVAPAKSPCAVRPLVDPRAAPLTVSAVISPPKRLSVCTWLVAVATPAVPESLEAEALIEPVLTTEPSAG